MIKFYYLIALFVIIQQINAQASCPAEANFQGCKKIEEDKLSKCSPVDYSCQCTAQKLIQQCFNLCPTYTSDATIHDSVVQSICSAVPATTSSILPSSMSPSLQAPSASMPSSSSSNSSQQHSKANSMMIPYFTLFILVCLSSLSFNLF